MGSTSARISCGNWYLPTRYEVFLPFKLVNASTKERGVPMISISTKCSFNIVFFLTFLSILSYIPVCFLHEECLIQCTNCKKIMLILLEFYGSFSPSAFCCISYNLRLRSELQKPDRFVYKHTCKIRFHTVN